MSSVRAVVAVVILCSGALAQEAGKPLRVPISRDAWVSDVGQERNQNTGGSAKLKTKGIQEMTILDIDPAALKGRVVTGATLFFKPTSKEIQRRLTISTLASDWVEGTSPSYAVQKGSVCWRWAATDEKPWAFPGSDLLAVCLGNGNTRWRYAEATAPDKDGWQSVAVDADVMAARVAGISYGFVMIDDIGSEYERNGDAFKFTLMLNRFVSSRESGPKSAPYMMVKLGAEDRKPPGTPAGMEQLPGRLPAGETTLKWITPADEGPAGVIGFVVRYADGGTLDWEKAKPVPQYLVPMAGKSGEAVTMHVRDLGLKVGAQFSIGIAAVDRAGNVGKPLISARTMPPAESIELAVPALKPFEPAGERPKVGNVEVAVVDALDKINVASGEMIPKRDEKYLLGNHLWSAKDKTIRLHAARGETVAFQIILSGKSEGMAVEVVGDAAASLNASLSHVRPIPTKAGPMPDPAVPLKPGSALPAAGADEKHAAVLVELVVPKNGKAGAQDAIVRLSEGGNKLDLKIDLTVWDFTLPDQLSFIPEMNSYGLPADDIPYYRLAQQHRTCLNRLGYNWQGGIKADTAPKWDGKTFDWTEYDRHYGPILDGTAFKDLPRAGVPVECFYLPINENWPMDVNKHFKGGYWADKAFDEEYRKQLVEATRQFAEHFAQKGWTKTLVQFYLNNKVYNKKDSWSKSSATWIFDEPVNTQDFHALRWYGVAFHEGVAAFPDVRMVYRCDISRPQWQREMLDGVVNYNVIGGAFRQYQRQVMDRKARTGEIVLNYGTSNNIEESNIQPAAWCIDTWTAGGDGVLPWQTIGSAKSWKEADQLSLFYPGAGAGVDGLEGPVASIRLKSYLRGQQDVEYLTLLQETTGKPRWAVAAMAREVLKLKASLKKTSEEDAGLISYGGLDPQDLWAMRVRLGQMLNDAKPAAKAKPMGLLPRPSDPKTLGGIGGDWMVGDAGRN